MIVKDMPTIDFTELAVAFNARYDNLDLSFRELDVGFEDPGYRETGYYFIYNYNQQCEDNTRKMVNELLRQSIITETGEVLIYVSEGEIARYYI